MSEPSVGALSTCIPPPMCEEPIETGFSTDESLACTNATAQPEEGSEPGTRALVERFGGQEGASGTGEPPRAPEAAGVGSPCDDELLRGIASCGNAIRTASGAGGTGAVFAAIACAGALSGYVECLVNESIAAGNKP